MSSNVCNVFDTTDVLNFKLPSKVEEFIDAYEGGKRRLGFHLERYVFIPVLVSKLLQGVHSEAAIKMARKTSNVEAFRMAVRAGKLSPDKCLLNGRPLESRRKRLMSPDHPTPISYRNKHDKHTEEERVEEDAFKEEGIRIIHTDQEDINNEVLDLDKSDNEEDYDRDCDCCVVDDDHGVDDEVKRGEYLDQEEEQRQLKYEDEEADFLHVVYDDDNDDDVGEVYDDNKEEFYDGVGDSDQDGVDGNDKEEYYCVCDNDYGGVDDHDVVDDDDDDDLIMEHVMHVLIEGSAEQNLNNK